MSSYLEESPKKTHNWTAEELMSDLEEFLGDVGTPF